MKKIYLIYLFSMISTFALFADGDEPEQKPIDSNYETVVSTPDDDPAPSSEEEKK